MFVELMPLLKETPLSFTGSAEELDSELGRHLVSYVDSHVALGNTLAEAKAELEAAAKAARQKVKTTQQTSKPDPAVAKKDESPGPTEPEADTTPSLFALEQNAEPTTQAAGEERGKATS